MIFPDPKKTVDASELGLLFKTLGPALFFAVLIFLSDSRVGHLTK